MRQVKLKVDGIMCQGCVNRIDNSLKTIKGINNYSISLEDKIVALEINDDSVLAKVIATITDLGFEVLKF